MDSAFSNGPRWRALIPVLPILLGFVATSLAFNLTVPLLEAPDETSHVAVLRIIEARHALPVQRPPADFPAGQEGSQPPLYYLIGAALYHLSPTPALAPTFSRQNPFVSFQRSTADAANRNFYGHSLDEGFPYRGDVLGLHLARMAGLLMGCLTVLFTYLIAREIWPRAGFVAVLGASLVAFNPELAFISGVVNNDNAIAMGATIVLWCLVRWIVRGGSTRLALGLGLALASALLAKTDGILLIPLVVVVLGVDFVRARGVFGEAASLKTLPPRLTAPPGEGGKGGRREEVGDEGIPGPLASIRVLAQHPSLSRALIVVLLPALLAGWWFARNQILYGDPLGYRVMLAANAAMIRRAPLGPISALAVLVNARGTFWGIFGWTNVLYPAWVYQVLDGFTLVCAAGLAIGTWKARGSLARAVGRLDRRAPGCPAKAREPAWTDRARFFLTIESGKQILAILLLGSWSLLVFASLVRWVQINQAADQWRLFFGAIAPVAIFLALGVDQIRLAVAGLAGYRRSSPERGVASLPRPFSISDGEGEPGAALGAAVSPLSISNGEGRGVRPVLPVALTLLGLTVNAVVLWTVIRPAFYPTVVAAGGATPSAATRFGANIELVKATVHPARLRSGDKVEVDLEWQAVRTPTRDWSVSLGLVDGAGTTLTRVQSWPEGGRAPTTAWRPGVVYLDRYVLSPSWSSSDPQLATIWLNLYDASVLGGPSLPVADASGKAIGNGVVVGQVKLLPSDQTTLRPSVPFHASFGPSIELLGYDAAGDSRQLRLTLYWRDEAAVGDDYTVFVHVAEPNGRVVAQHDGPPRDGSFPTTAWEPGEVIRDTHLVDLGGVPAGTYPVLVGIYQHTTGARLAVRLTDGSGVPNDALPLYDLKVSPPGA